MFAVKTQVIVYSRASSSSVSVVASNRDVFISDRLVVTSALAYWIAGYAFAFGGSSNFLLGTRYWASERFGARDLHPEVENYTNSNNVLKLNNQDPYIHYFYNYMLAFLVTNIAASAFAERCRVPVYILFSIVMSGKLR